MYKPNPNQIQINVHIYTIYKTNPNQIQIHLLSLTMYKLNLNQIQIHLHIFTIYKQNSNKKYVFKKQMLMNLNLIWICFNCNKYVDECHYSLQTKTILNLN